MQFRISSGSLALHLKGNMDISTYSSDQLPPNNQIENMPESQQTTSEVGLGLESLATGEWSVVMSNYRIRQSKQGARIEQIRGKMDTKARKAAIMLI